MTKHLLLALTISIAVWVLGCATAGSSPSLPDTFPPEVNLDTYSFEYTPTKTENDLAATIALVSPQFEFNVADKTSVDFSPITTLLAEALISDFTATLIAMQYSTLGPYDSLDAMVFGDKQTSDLVLVPRFVLNVKSELIEEFTPFSRPVRKQRVSGAGASGVYRDVTFYRQPGTLTANGFIELTMFEALSEQKVWVKRINIVKPDVPFETFIREEYQYTFDDFSNFILNLKTPLRTITTAPPEYDGRLTAIASVLQSSYSTMLEEFSRYFDPQEITQVIKDARLARERARF